MSEDPPATKDLPAPQHSAYPSGDQTTQGILFPFERTDMRHLNDREYKEYKDKQGAVGTEHDSKFTGENVGTREELLMKMGKTASDKPGTALFPENMSRGDVEARDPIGDRDIWKELSEIDYLCGELIALSPENNLAVSIRGVLHPITRGGESHPNAIKNGLIGSSSGKEKTTREAAFKQAMHLLQHGTREQRLELINDLQLRLAIARGEPDPVDIAKQLIFQGMEDSDLKK